MNNNWNLKSVDFMKLTQDIADSKSPLTPQFIDQNASLAKELGANYIAISVPYDLPNGGGDVIAQTKNWVDAIRKYNLNVWHRHSFCSDEGWYGVAQDTSSDRLQDIKNYILAHPNFFANGDIFTPKPEPQNMGIAGVNRAAGSPARFPNAAAFNQWLRDSISVSKEAFTQLGLDVKIGYFGFDGFIICGYNNPDWQGKSFLEPATIQAMGNIITGDHYPELVGKPMTDFISVFKQTWPGVKFIAGEWGAAGNTDPVAQANTTLGTLANDPIVTGVNYWHMGPGKQEALLNDDLTKKPTFDAVKAFFTSITTPVPTPTPIPTPMPQPTPQPMPQPIPIDNANEASIDIGKPTGGYVFYPFIVNGKVIGKVKIFS